ncbi:hypothetical protein PR048_031873 [Dryococelus australis]|uniref:Peroxidase n=1 Tax=Dryococelus australis TaxID=614101 RepID=A0ABQ9GAI2_9NEOP|nr:hypothetical protein PR048_031873 [Dryococelus australis]
MHAVLIVERMVLIVECVVLVVVCVVLIVEYEVLIVVSCGADCGACGADCEGKMDASPLARWMENLYTTNTTRPWGSRFKLRKIEDWIDINPTLFSRKPELMRLLATAYSNRLDNVDPYIGGMLETRSGPGELFTAIIKEQFSRIRDADRFWFENTDNGIFTEDEVKEIRAVKLQDIIVNCTDIAPDEIQESVFFWRNNDPCPQPVQLNSTLLEPCKYLKGYDYFEVSSLPSTLASHQGELGSIPGRVPEFSQVGIVPDDAVDRRVFTGISRFPRSLIWAPPHIHLNHPPRLSRPRC